MKPATTYRLRYLGLPLGLGLALILAVLLMIIRLQPATARTDTSVPVVEHQTVAQSNILRPLAAGTRSIQPPTAPMAQVQQACTYVFTQVTTTGAGVTNGAPSISDDGRKIVFSSNGNIGGSNPEENYEIYLYDGTLPATVITNTVSGVTNEQPSISGDGNWIAFASDETSFPGTTNNPDGNQEIFVVNIAALNFTQVSESTGSFLPGFNIAPSINANGSAVAFVSDHDYPIGSNADNNFEIFLYNGAVSQVTSSTLTINNQPSIDGNGTRIAFVSEQGGNQAIMLYDSTTGLSQIPPTGGGNVNTYPSIDNSGNWITFASNGDFAGDNGDGNQEIFVYNKTTGVINQVTSTPLTVTNDLPSISDDGNRVAFVSTGDLKPGDNLDGNQEIFVAAIDLPNVTFEQVTSTPLTVTNDLPSFNQFGDTIAFVSNGDLDNKGNTHREIFQAVCGQLIDLTPNKTVSIDPGKLDVPLIYTIIITNNGPQKAAEITLTDVLPSSVLFASASSDCQSPPVNSVVTCTLTNIDSGYSGTVTIAVTPTQLGWISNTVTVFNGSSQVDRDRTNNAITITTEIRSIADLEVTKTVVPTETKKGQPIIYTIVITNTGPFTATDVTLSDTLPAKIFPQLVITDDAGNNFGNGQFSNVEIVDGLLRLSSGDSGHSTSAITDAGGIVGWNNLAWIPQRPLYKELPDNGQSEGGYPTGNVNMSGNELLVHFNGNLLDTSGKNHFPAHYLPQPINDGKFNQAYRFDGNDFVYYYTGFIAPTEKITMMAWVKPTSTFGTSAVIRLCCSDEFSWSISRQGTIWYVTDGSSSRSTGSSVVTDDWQHVAAVFDPDPNVNTVTFYRNGEAVFSAPIVSSNFNYYVDVGWNDNLPFDKQYFYGDIDELAVFRRALTSQEILDHYLRGALRLKYQVRSCDDPNCTGEQFVGPKKAPDAYYSELLNNSPSLPSFPLDVTPQQYFQYKVQLERDAGVSSLYWPELKLVKITLDSIDNLIITPSSLDWDCIKGRTVVCNLSALTQQDSPQQITIEGIAQTAAPISNTANVASTAYQTGTNEFINVSSTVTTVIQPVDLSVTKSTLGSVLAGDTLPYTITVTNNSSDTVAAEVTLTDKLPYVAGDPPNLVLLQPLPVGCEGHLPDVICTFDELNPGETITLVINIRPLTDGPFENDVAVTVANNPPPAEEKDSATATVQAATDLQVTKSASSLSLTAGEPLTYTITVNNIGPMKVDTVTLNDFLAASIPYTAGTITTSSGSCSNPVTTNPIICNLGPLSSTGTISVTLVITPGSEEGVITNTVNVSSELTERIPNNNTATVVAGGSSGRIFLPIILKSTTN